MHAGVPRDHLVKFRVRMRRRLCGDSSANSRCRESAKQASIHENAPSAFGFRAVRPDGKQAPFKRNQRSLFATSGTTKLVFIGELEMPMQKSLNSAPLFLRDSLREDFHLCQLRQQDGKARAQE
jgi:hypothetical protein